MLIYLIVILSKVPTILKTNAKSKIQVIHSVTRVINLS